MERNSGSIGRLYEDEALTADMDDAAARALLHWAEEQLQEGRPEPAVRQSLQALGKVIASRAALLPAEARARLEAAGLAGLDEDALAGLWDDRSTPTAEWVGKLVALAAGAHRPAVTAPPGASLDAAVAAPPAPSPPAAGAAASPESALSAAPPPGGPPAAEERAAVPWWRRLFSRREPR